MIVYEVEHGPSKIQFPTLIQAETYAQQHNLSAPVEITVQNVVDYVAIVSELIRQKQELAPSLLRELYAKNTLAGISTQQSDQMFDEYADVVLRIREGAFPTAYYRLQQKQPSGFVTQALLNEWLTSIAAYL